MRSTWRCWKRLEGMVKAAGGSCTWRTTLDRWQSTHSRAHSDTSLDRPRQQKRDETRRLEARIPGWPKLCIESKIRRRRLEGTNGRNVPDETSPTRRWPLTRLLTTRRAGEERRRMTSGQVDWPAATKPIGTESAEAVTAAITPTAEEGGLESASATTFSLPARCRRSVVNSETNARCRCCLADQGGDTRVMAATRGRWSVKMVKGRPSSMKRN